MSAQNEKTAETAPETDAIDNPVNPGAEINLDAVGDVAGLQAEIAALKDQLLRAVAETENTRRRLTRERDETAKYAASNFAKEMLGVADNLARALAAIPAEALASDEALKNLYDGVSATERQLDAAFTRQSIKRIWPEGEKFDSNLHQAMFEVPGTDKPQGTVVQVLQAGYVMHDRLLRPALVGVAKGEPKPAGDQPPHVDTVA
ncbi:molecular chaperone GrpE [Dongia mobilis]|uniref:Protein GrpE n=1 Tax=Dongia mobilis TaxID=578943 RepID=A0A4R6WTH9_9PROT|nr:nucleotide exchange factor GrpE [Dongia mobilis]TDQ82404.1 molecular chaperone GrpE [Dongia mobilis]